MKAINLYINEKLVIGDNLYDRYNYQPKDKKELIACIEKKIEKEGLGTKDDLLDLNDIDTSEITDMSFLFDGEDGYLKELSKNGHFDISDWNVRNVKNMSYMFWDSKFNNDLSKWDVSNVENMKHMFNGSSFNGDISNWNISSVIHIRGIFNACPLRYNPPKWYKR